LSGRVSHIHVEIVSGWGTTSPSPASQRQFSIKVV
jgi:hypothetical protein